MGTKEKNNKKIVMSIVIPLVVLALAGIIGGIIGVFDGLVGFLGMIKPNKNIIFRLIVMIAFMVFLSNLLLMVLRAMQKRNGRIGTLSTVLSSLVKYGVVLVGTCWGLSIIGVNVSTIIASVGIVALILGFGAESLVADLVTGIFILFENQYNVGDIIEVSGFRGTVQEIGIRTLSIVDAGGNVKIINNSDLKDIINRSNQQSIAICEIGISYDMNLEEVEMKLPEIFEEIKNKHTDVFIGEIKYLGVEELADSCVKLKITAEVNEKDVFNGRRILNREMKIAFDKEKIAIPYPQIEMHAK